MLERNYNVNYCWRHNTEHHKPFVSKVGAQSAVNQLPKGVAPEKGRGYNAKGGGGGAQLLGHLGHNQVYVLAAVIEEKLGKAKA